MSQNTTSADKHVIYNDCLARIDEMRTNGAKNETLIDEAIKLIFFKLGDMPTQQSVLNMVKIPGRSPSAGTVQGRLNHFRTTLRDKASLKVGHHDLPEAVNSAFSTFLEKLMETANTAAKATLENERIEILEKADTIQRESEQVSRNAKAVEDAAKEQVLEAMGLVKQARQEVETANLARVEAERRLLASDAKQVEQAALIIKINEHIDQLERYHQEERADHARAMADLQQKIENMKRTLTVADGQIQSLRLDVRREQDNVDRVRKDLGDAVQSRNGLEDSLKVANDRIYELTNKLTLANSEARLTKVKQRLKRPIIRRR